MADSFFERDARWQKGNEEMSGPKTGQWRVVSDNEPHITWPEAQNVLREYLGKIMSLRDQLIALQKKHPELTIHYGVEDIRTDLPESGQVIVDELNNRLDIYRRLRGEIVRVEGLVALRCSLLNMARSVGTRTAAANRQRKEQMRADLEKLRQTALRVAERVAPGSPEVEMEGIRNLLTTIMDENLRSESRLETLVDSLRLHVDRLNAKAREAARLQEAHAKEAARLATALLGVNTQVSEDVLVALRRVETGETPLTESLCAKASQEIARARQEQDRRKAATILRSSLVNLGYGVEDDFTTAFVSGGKGYFQHPRWADHYCRLSVSPEDNIMNFDVVRLGDEESISRDETLEDVAVEQQWCSLFPDLIEELRNSGLEYTSTRACPPGALPMQRINEPHLQSHRQRVTEARGMRHIKQSS